MYFQTKLKWKDKNPEFATFDDPEHSVFRWRVVEMQQSVYYFHVHIVPRTTDSEPMGTNFLCGSIEDTLEILSDYPQSTLSLQIPPWLNKGEPGLYRVVAIHKSTDPAGQPYIVECANGKMHILQLDECSQKINPAAVEKVTLWPQPQAATT